jgi:hypothetical protein
MALFVLLRYLIIMCVCVCVPVVLFFSSLIPRSRNKIKSRWNSHFAKVHCSIKKKEDRESLQSVYTSNRKFLHPKKTPPNSNWKKSNRKWDLICATIGTSIDGLQQTLTVLFCVHQMNVDDGPERNRNRRDTSGENIKGQPRWLKRNKGGYNLIHGWTTARANTQPRRRMKQTTNSSSSPHNSW